LTLIHLERDRYLETKPWILTEKYYKDELDKNGKDFTDKTVEFFNIISKVKNG